MAFRSAVDGWLRVLIVLNAAVVSFAMAPLLTEGSPGRFILALLILLVAVGLPVWVLLTTDYRVDGQTLRIRSGPFRWRIALADITAVRDSRSMLSSPALSLRRLEIVYGQGRRLLVSPADRTGFLAAIGHRQGSA